MNQLFNFVTDDLDILVGDCLETLKSLPDNHINCCVTSPPYYNLRDYDNDNQIGLESSPEEYVNNLVKVFREVKRVLKDDGTLWLNLGDSYASRQSARDRVSGYSDKQSTNKGKLGGKQDIPLGLKQKDLIGIPWRVAFALQQDGWYLRQDIIWHKPNPMPESVKDRCTKSHEYIFLLSKSPKYYYDYKAIREDSINPKETARRMKLPVMTGSKHESGGFSKNGAKHTPGIKPFDGKKNKRSVWTVNVKSYREAHFATYPPKLIKPCILAGCPEGGVVLDPFAGAGTTGLVALSNKRKAILCELNKDYVEIIKRRLLD
tara:strand:+ start:12834 stop:13787 length:954 start_codon:yes stop_codon:yes gene_type:complete